MAKAINVKFRPANADDWLIVSGIVAATWRGEDYITEELWQHWVDDNNGYLVVAMVAGILAGFGHITEFNEAEWWLEGVRVNQMQQGKGVGSAIVEHLVNYFKHNGKGALRCVVDSQNRPSIQMVEASKLHHMLSLTCFEAPAKVGNEYEFYKVGPKAADYINSYLRYSPMYRISNYLEHNWVIRVLSEDYLNALLSDAAHEVLIWRAFDRLHGLAVIVKVAAEKNLTYDPSQVLYIGYLDAPDDTTLLAMVAALQTLAAREGREKLRWYMPARAGFETVASIEGSTLRTESELLLFELTSDASDLST